jgi:hypothetical protein
MLVDIIAAKKRCRRTRPPFGERLARKLLAIFTVCVAIGVLAFSVWAELGSNIPSDSQLLIRRAHEGGSSGSGIFDIAVPPPGTILQPAQRIPRDRFGVVGPFPLTMQDLQALVYPDATLGEREKLLEGLTFFTTPHTAAQGLGPINNQKFCLGCHLNTAEGVATAGLLSANSCISGSTCVSNVARAARSTPTNFEFTSLDSVTGGGRPADNLDAVDDTGKTAAFTVFGDFDPSHKDAPTNPTGIGFFDPLDGKTANIVTGTVSQPFGGQIQHTRPAVEACVPVPIAPVDFDENLEGPSNPTTGLHPSGFRRSVGERAGPPYIGRGLMEAVPTNDLLANADPHDVKGHNSSLGNFSSLLGCKTDCVSGRPNSIPRTLKMETGSNGKLVAVTGFVGGVGRFGLRANGVEILQFVIGGLQGELSFTSLINDTEINFPTLFPITGPITEPPACMNARSTIPEVHLSTPFSVRNLLRNTAPPEFGDALLDLLESPDPSELQHGDSTEAKVQRGAQLFGIDLNAFANRTIAGRMPEGGDGLDPNAINQADRKLDCVGCHTPIQRTGQSPAEVGAEHLSFVWAPIFSDLLIHKMPVINAERFSPRPRDPLLISRSWTKNSFDLPRNLADDTFTNQKASANGREFRTAPLMGLGRIGPPFLHDARVYLSDLTVDRTPASTVTTNHSLTNAPLVVHGVDDAILAAIELHDLPAPDDENTPHMPGAGCPVPRKPTNVNYGPSPQDVICPPYDSPTSRINRSDAREVILRFRKLAPEDQQAVIEFLKQL